MDPKQQISPTGIRILLLFVVVYLAVGSYMYFFMTLPVVVYVFYGVVSWIGGMMLFYRLHKSYMAQFERELE